MKILVIPGHPDEKSFNHAIAGAVREELSLNGHQVFFHDLYAEGFQPVMTAEEIPKKEIMKQDVEAHCRELSECEGVIVIHPNWWGQPPAILKGWIDRVIRPGIAYQFLEADPGNGVPVGLLKEKVAVVFNTSDTETEREKTVFGDPLDTIWKNCVFGLCGITKYHRKVFNVVVTSTEEQRAQWLEDTRQLVRTAFGKAR